jgi:hypothetical protein
LTKHSYFLKQFSYKNVSKRDLSYSFLTQKLEPQNCSENFFAKDNNLPQATLEDCLTELKHEVLHEIRSAGLEPAF